MIWLGLVLLVTFVYSMIGLFLDRENIDFQVAWEPISPYKERYENERLRNSRIKYSFNGSRSEKGVP